MQRPTTYAPINVKPHTPRAGHIRGNVGICTSGLSTHWEDSEYTGGGGGGGGGSPANRQVELVILEKNVANLCLCHIKKCHHGS